MQDLNQNLKKLVSLIMMTLVVFIFPSIHYGASKTSKSFEICADLFGPVTKEKQRPVTTILKKVRRQKPLKPQFDLSDFEINPLVTHQIAQDYYNFIIGLDPSLKSNPEKIEKLLSRYWKLLIPDRKKSFFISNEISKGILSQLQNPDLTQLEELISRTLLFAFLPETYEPLEVHTSSDLDLIISLLKKNAPPSLKFSAMSAIKYNPTQLPGLSSPEQIARLSDEIENDNPDILNDIFITEFIFSNWVIEYPTLTQKSDLNKTLEILKTFYLLNLHSHRPNRAQQLATYMTMKIASTPADIDLFKSFDSSAEKLEKFLVDSFIFHPKIGK